MRRRGARATSGGRGFRVAAAAVILLAAGLFAEGFARVVGPEVPAWQGKDPEGVIMVGHPSRLWGMSPGVRMNVSTTATINELGLRGELPPVPRPPGRQRILVLGDSSYFGHGIPDADTVTVKLTELLRAKGLDVDTVNGAVPGYSTEQVRLLLEEAGWGLEPSLLVLASLWSDNNFDHFRDADLLRTQRTFSGNPFAHSAFYQLLAGVIDRMRGGDGAHIVTWTRKSEWPSGGTRRVPITHYAANLDTIIREAAAKGIGATLLAPCNRDMAAGTVAPDVSWGPYFEAQRQVAAHHGLPVIALEPALREAAIAGGGADGLYVDEMHPSVEGARVVAETIAAELLAAGWPQKPLLGRAEAFPADTVTDVAPGGESEVTNPMSPQSNLFPRSSGMGAVAQGTQHRVQPGPTAAGGWVATGTVTATSWPVKVELRSKNGSVLGGTVLQASGPFELDVKPGVEAVTLVAVGIDGREVSAAAIRGTAVSLSLE